VFGKHHIHVPTNHYYSVHYISDYRQLVDIKNNDSNGELLLLVKQVKLMLKRQAMNERCRNVVHP
jgi:hypothetical protein